MALQSRFEELKKGGKLDKFIEKKRRRTAAKERQSVPQQRRGADEY